ncbi:MAG: OsmC family peroxiredoxin [Naasia sp.]|nr:OsmC family peroxiredoxin [Naasia sp.]
MTADTLTLTPAAQERADRLDAAGAAWKERISADARNAQLTYKVTSTGKGAVATQVVAGKHRFLVDEPAALAGDDIAASPVEYALGALLSCQVVVYRLYAQALGIVVDQISVEAEADLDVRRLFGLDNRVRAGFGDIRLVVSVTGPEELQRYEQLKDAVDEHCPVFDLFTNPTPVSTTIRKA